LLGPFVQNEIVGKVVLGADGSVFGMPVVVAPFKIKGDGIGGVEVPFYGEAAEGPELFGGVVLHGSSP
jgi:hypothetical protein